MPKEQVNHPIHYHPGTYEAIKVIEAWELGFCLGNVIKYISRAGRKHENVLEDLKKARWYLDRHIENMQQIKTTKEPVVGPPYLKEKTT